MFELSDAATCINLSLDTPLGLLHASVDSRAAGLRELTLAGSPLVQSYPEGDEAPYFSGRTLLPWPNRLAHGIWNHEGHTLKLPIDDYEHQAALHGLLSSRVYALGERTSDSVTWETTLEPSDGYPFTLGVLVRYALEGTGLRVTHSVTNLGSRDAPFAAGAHPFLRAGDGDLAAMRVTSDVHSYLIADDNLIPTAEVPLGSGHSLNLSEGVALSDVSLDTAFRVTARPEGIVTRLTSSTGHATELWQDSSWGWVQVFLTDTFPTATGNVWALAVEPMTSPPNALATGENIITLAPGETWTASWGIRSVVPVAH